MTRRHRFMLTRHPRQIDEIDRSIQELKAAGTRSRRPLRHRVEQLTAIPGISATAATVLLAEVGMDMNGLEARRGPKKAIVAAAASILTTVYHMLRDGTVYQDLGAGHFDTPNRDCAAKSLVRRLQASGFDVDVRPAA